jgi:hypothetical protein
MHFQSHIIFIEVTVYCIFANLSDCKSLACERQIEKYVIANHLIFVKLMVTLLSENVELREHNCYETILTKLIVP